MRSRLGNRQTTTRAWRVLAIVLSLASMPLLVGCVVLPRSLGERPPLIERHPLDDDAVPRGVAVVASHEAPKVSLLATVRGSDEASTTVAGGAAAGAAAGAFAGSMVALVVAIAALAGPGGLLALPASVAPFIGGGAAVGLAAGATAGMEAVVPEEQAAAIRRVATDAIGSLRLSEAVATQVAAGATRLAGLEAVIVDSKPPAASGDYRPLHKRGLGVAIRLKVNEVGFEGSGKDTLAALFMTAEAQLVETASGSPRALRGLVYVSPKHAAARWAADDAALTRSEIERAYGTLAERIVEDLLLRADVGWQQPNITALSTPVPFVDPSATVCGLAPRNPPLDWEGGFASPRHLATSGVDSVTPLLAWEPAPAPEPEVYVAPEENSVNWRPLDRPSAAAARRAIPWEAARADDITYDLRIWRMIDDAPGPLVYERQGLQRPEHRVEAPLQPASTYFWSVRMRYVADGRPGVTRWSAANAPVFFLRPTLARAVSYSRVDDGVLSPVGCPADDMTPCRCLDFIPAANYYRFRTP